MAQIFISINACVLFHMTQLIFRSKTKQLEIKETVSKRSTEHGEVNAQQPCTLTAALLSASEFPGGSAAGPSDGNSSCVVITW